MEEQQSLLGRIIADEARKIVDEAIKSGGTTDESVIAALTRIATEYFKQQASEAGIEFADNFPFLDRNNILSDLVESAHFHFEKRYLDTYTSFWFTLFDDAIHSALDEVELPPPFIRVPPNEKNDVSADQESDRLPRGKVIDYPAMIAAHLFDEGAVRVWVNPEKVWNAIYEGNQRIFPRSTSREELSQVLEGASYEDRERILRDFDEAVAGMTDPSPENIARMLAEVGERDRERYSHQIYRGFFRFSFHTIRCGLAATLYLAAQYSRALEAASEGRASEEIDSLRPDGKTIDKYVRNYLADILTQPLRKKPKDEKLPRLFITHEKLKPLVQDARSFWKNNQKEANWRLMLKMKDGLEEMPDDLVDLLDEAMPAPTGYTDTDPYGKTTHHQAANISLLWAARLCGDPEGELSISRLREISREQKNAKKKNTAENRKH